MGAARGSETVGDELALVLSCEHGGNAVPRAFRPHFEPPPSVLASHRGHDPGTPELAARMALATGAPLIVNLVTRLLVDANRSASNPTRFSSWSERLPEPLRERAAREVWAKHRDAVTAVVASRAALGVVLHVSVHSFTPRLRGEVRDVDVGFLYDPRRPLERALVTRWLRALAELEPRLRLRRNQPYKGTDDGLTTALRKNFAAQSYAGIELEVSQRFPRAAARGSRARWERLMAALATSLLRATSTPP
jgi:predicted N-formylglutamate amidohydrolase